MKRWSVACVLACLFVPVPFLIGQQDPSSPAPIPDSHDLTSSDLIAWSGMQSPQPVSPSGQQPLGPDPHPETQPPKNPTPSPDAAPTKTAVPAQDSDQNQTPAARTFLGTISKRADAYVLKTESTSYQLDAQDKAKQFEGQKVRVIGILDPSGQSIQVQSIDPIS
jgi:hypothetical protein